MSNKKVILSAKDISVEFQVRNRTLRAIRNISVDLHGLKSGIFGQLQ